MNTHATPKLAYRLNEACAALGLSRAQLYALMNEGQLGYTQVGGVRLIPTALKQRTVEFGTTQVQAIQETARTFATPANMIRAADAITTKPETAVTMAVTSVALNQVAHILSDVPLVAFADDGARGILESDMRLGVRDALDQLCFAALTAAGLPNNNFATEPLLERCARRPRWWRPPATTPTRWRCPRRTWRSWTSPSPPTASTSSRPPPPAPVPRCGVYGPWSRSG